MDTKTEELEALRRKLDLAIFAQRQQLDLLTDTLGSVIPHDVQPSWENLYLQMEQVHQISESMRKALRNVTAQKLTFSNQFVTSELKKRELK